MEEILRLEKGYEFIEALELLLDYDRQSPDDFWLVAVLVLASVAYDWAKLLFAVFVFLYFGHKVTDTRDTKESQMLKKIFKELINKR